MFDGDSETGAKDIRGSELGTCRPHKGVGVFMGTKTVIPKSLEMVMRKKITATPYPCSMK